jgi:hypothetical protein
MSDRVMQGRRMTRNHRLSQHFANRASSYRTNRRVPRGLAMLRALRLRLAGESRPQFCQLELQFGK